MEEHVLDVVIWETGKGEDLISTEQPEVTKKIMGKIEKVANNMGHKFCFWVLGNVAPNPLVGSSNELRKIIEAVEVLVLRFNLTGYLPICTDSVFKELQDDDTQRAQQQCPPHGELH